MNDKSEGELSRVKDIVEVVGKVLDKVPIYPDLIQPAAQEIGKSLVTVAKGIKITLAPLRAVVWGFETIENYITEAVAKRLKSIEESRLQTPDINVAGPALEALKFAGSNTELRELYANLLATSIDSKTSANAHPAFVEIIKQLSSDEAKLLTEIKKGNFGLLMVLSNHTYGMSEVVKHISWLKRFCETQCAYPDNYEVYLDNLCRLGLTEIRLDFKLVGSNIYEPLKKFEEVQKWIKISDDKRAKGENHHISFKEYSLHTTQMGHKFISACVDDSEHT
jgi:Abortive infection alpha